MTDSTSLEDRCLAAAARRYRSLDSHMYVELSGLMPHKSVRLATDAACALVRRELESTYAALLEANALRDEAQAKVSELETALERVRALHSRAECANARCKQGGWCAGCDPNAESTCDEHPWPCETVLLLEPDAQLPDRFAAWIPRVEHERRLAAATTDARVARGIIDPSTLTAPDDGGRFAPCARCTEPVLVYGDGSTSGGVDTLRGIRCDQCLNAPEDETEAGHVD